MMWEPADETDPQGLAPIAHISILVPGGWAQLWKEGEMGGRVWDEAPMCACIRTIGVIVGTARSVMEAPFLHSQGVPVHL